MDDGVKLLHLTVLQRDYSVSSAVPDTSLGSASTVFISVGCRGSPDHQTAKQ